MGMFDFLKRKKEPEEEPVEEVEEEFASPYTTTTINGGLGEPPIREEPKEESSVEGIPPEDAGAWEFMKAEEGKRRAAEVPKVVEEEESLRLRLREAEERQVKARSRVKLSRAEERATMRKLGETGWQRAERARKGTGKAASALFKVATLGGRPRVSKDFFIPKPQRDLYVPTSMRRLTAPAAGESGEVLREATSPRLGSLQRLTRPSSMQASPLARMMIPSSGMLPKRDSSLDRLRELTVPRGLTRIEQEAYKEIRRNHDIDTKSHVISELVGLGASQPEAGRAVDGLARKGVVRKDKTFEGEPVYEVVR